MIKTKMLKKVKQKAPINQSTNWQTEKTRKANKCNIQRELYAY